MISFLQLQYWLFGNMGGANTKNGTASGPGDGMVEAVVCSANDMKDGEMRVVDVGEGKALLVKDKGEFHAVGTKCSHYGAPLVKGALCNGRVRCPWHGACFNVTTGDIEDFPGLDSIPKYHVAVANGEVRVRARKQDLLQGKRLKGMSTSCTGDTRVFLILGGGGAGATCAETLRQEGFCGKIIMATREPHAPIDRPKLSKMLDATTDKLILRKEDFMNEYNIELLTGHEAVSIDVDKKCVEFKDKSPLAFDKLLLATGGSPRPLDLPGSDLKNVCLLRGIQDGNHIAAAAKGKKVVVIGTSFIGLEVAGYLSDKADSVTVVGRSEVPLKHALGKEIGTVVKKLLEEKGVRFVFSNPPSALEGSGDALETVVLQDGTRLEAQLCVVGTGVTPSTDLTRGSGLLLSTEGYIQVNKKMETNKENVYAAGDIVQFPLFMADDKHTNIQHWQMANQQGRVAGLNMMDKNEEIHSVPFFWTQILGKSIRYAGYGGGHDDVIIEGDLDAHSFVAYYTLKDKVVAVASMGRDPVCAQAAEMFANGRTITKQEVRGDATGWISRLAG